LIAIGVAIFGLFAGFLLGAWVRQDSINGLTEENRRLRAELALTRGNEGRWQIAVAELKAQLEDAREMMN
jgi:Na+/glutamate symporter